jgi:hypothetical protein
MVVIHLVRQIESIGIIEATSNNSINVVNTVIVEVATHAVTKA